MNFSIYSKTNSCQNEARSGFADFDENRIRHMKIMCLLDELVLYEERRLCDDDLRCILTIYLLP